MRVRPTLQSGYGAARMRPEIGTVINIIFSKKSVFMCGNLDCNKWFIWFETRLAWWPHRSSPISVASLISTSKTGVHFKLCFLLKLPRNFWSSEFLFPSLLRLETLKFFAARYKSFSQYSPLRFFIWQKPKFGPLLQRIGQPAFLKTKIWVSQNSSPLSKSVLIDTPL